MATANCTEKSSSTNVREFSSRAWLVHNVLTFMIESMPADTEEGLPVQCTLVGLRGQIESLADDLANESDRIYKLEGQQS